MNKKEKEILLEIFPNLNNSNYDIDSLQEEIVFLITSVKRAVNEKNIDLDWFECEIHDLLYKLYKSWGGEYRKTSVEVAKILDLDLQSNSLYQEQFELLNENSKEIKFLWDTRDDWEVKKVSKNITSILWYRQQDFYLKTLSFIDLIYEDDLERVRKEVNQYTKIEKRTEFVQEYRVKKSDGTILQVLDKTLVEYDEENNPKFLYGYLYDLTEQKELEKNIKELEKEKDELLYTDILTGDNNISKLYNDLREILERKEDVALVFLKISSFERYNLLYWVEIWNYLIKEISKELKQKFWDVFSLYKIDWTKFCLLTTREDYWENSREIVPRVESELQNFKTKTSFWSLIFNFNLWGVCTKIIDEWKVSVSDLVNKWLLSFSKSISEGITTVYSNEMEINVKTTEREVMKIERVIEEAFEKNLFFPYYQWIRNNKTGEIEKYEILVRLRDQSENKYLLPEEFLKFIEVKKQTNKLMIQVIEKTFQEISNEKISFNFWENELKREFLENFFLLVKKYWINPNNIIIEILEKDINEKSLFNLEELRELWIRIAIDDFGIWYSNFWRLIDVTPDFIKIDWSLIQSILWNKKKIKVLRTILELARNIWAKTIAEQVEDKETQELLEFLEVDYTQWYLFSKPERNI